MNEAVFVGGLGMAISMGLIVVGAVAASLLCYWLDGKMDHGEEH